MDYAGLKVEIKEISDIAESVPQPFRERCFEILLHHMLAEQRQDLPPTKILPSGGEEAGADVATKLEVSTKLRIKASLRVFMQRTNVTADELQRVILVEGDDVHFIREPAHGTVAKGQMEWALLLALKNAVISNELSTDPEDVRSICQEKGFYDKGNFSTIFKRQPYAGYFRQPLQPQGPRQTLTNDGQAALGELLKSLSRQGE